MSESDDDEVEATPDDPTPEKSDKTKDTKRSSRQIEMKAKNKKRKVDRISKEKNRIREILTKGVEGEEFRLTGMQLSDDEEDKKTS